jgi:N-acetyl-anhydromuramyl-L-alanine amidase AmpD|tara:strand:+ start:664 stop:1086 length:423 start_codon:yes stop_codon:yes gene_type:complete
MNFREETDTIVIHCADTPDDKDVDMAEIRRWHVEERGWSDIGYHFVIRRNGLVEAGRDVKLQGAHARQVNRKSVGICMVGRKDFDPRQFDSLKDTVMLLLKLYPGCKVIGHCDVEPKKPDCPGFDVNKWFTEAIPSTGRP